MKSIFKITCVCSFLGMFFLLLAEGNVSKAQGWDIEQIGTFSNIAESSFGIGVHASKAAMSVAKILVIPVKHFILQFKDLFCYSKDILKHSGLAGFDLFRLGGDVVAAPFVNGYTYPKQTAVVVAALLAAGAVYEGSIFSSDYSWADWQGIMTSLQEAL